ncbi:MAG: tetratricopeptide repeat protein [Candidatus Methylomirabilales bacterium]
MSSDGAGAFRRRTWAGLIGGIVLSLCSLGSLAHAAEDPARLNEQGIALAKEGRYEEAIRVMERALERDPAQPVLRQNLAAVHARFASVLLSERAFREAAGHYQAGIDLLPEEGSLFLGLGLALFEAGDLFPAVEALRRAVELAPERPEGFRLLGEAYYRRGDQSEAIRIWEEGLRRHAQDPVLRMWVDRLRREQRVEGDYSRQTGHHYTIEHVQDLPDHVVREILRILEQAYNDVGYDLGHYPQGETRVTLNADADFEALTRLPIWVGGVFDELGGRIRIPLRGIRIGEELRALLYHEYTHVVVHSLTGGRVPTWLNEGLALIAQRSPMDGAKAMAREAARGHGLPTLRVLSGPFGGIRTEEKVRLAYAASYSATQYLVDRVGMSGIQRLLRLMGGGQSFDDAFYEVTRLSLEEFDRDWREAVGRGE